MRRPAKLERAGALTPRDRIWAAIRIFGASLGNPWFSVAEIMVLSGQRADTVLSYLAGLDKAGFVELVLELHVQKSANKCRVLKHFRLKRDVGVEAPRVNADGKPVTQGIGREQLWRAMRILKTFECGALAAAASTEAHPVAVEEAKHYVKFLTRAGYLRQIEPSRGPLAALYSFLRARDTGPRAPLIARDKCVMDGNTGQIVFPPSPILPPQAGEGGVKHAVLGRRERKTGGAHGE